MNFFTVLVASSMINFQQPVQSTHVEPAVDTTKLEQIAAEYLKLRITDADFIQTTIVEQDSGLDYDVYLAFSADSTPVNTCKIHLNKNTQQTTNVKQISCVNYQKKIGFSESINSVVYD